MWNANPLQAERLSFMAYGSSTHRGQCTFLLTPNPRCDDVECEPHAGREIVFYRLWLENTKGEVHIFPNA